MHCLRCSGLAEQWAQPVPSLEEISHSVATVGGDNSADCPQAKIPFTDLGRDNAAEGDPQLLAFSALRRFGWKKQRTVRLLPFSDKGGGAQCGGWVWAFFGPRPAAAAAAVSALGSRAWVKFGLLFSTACCLR